MWKILLLISICLCITIEIRASESFDDDVDFRIMGGEKITIRNEYQFIVSLHGPVKRKNVKSMDHYCGGTILTNRWILTAAHCGPDPDDPVVDVWAGLVNFDTNDSFVQKIRVKETFIHPDYNRTSRSADVALMYLENDLQFSEFVQPIEIVQNLEPYPSGEVSLMGWGVINDGENFRLPKTLRAVNASIREYETCIGSKPSDKGVEICVGALNQTACKGDSGGPLVQKTDGVYQQIGIASYASQFCTGDAVYGHVGAYYESFIKPTMEKYHSNSTSNEQEMIRSNISNEFSFVVPIYLALNTSTERTKVCSGSILWNTWILTAASCVDMDDGTQFVVLKNLISTVDHDDWSDANTILVRAVHFHPDYQGFEDVHNNLAMLELSEPLVLGSTLNRLMVPRTDSEISNYLKTSGYQNSTNNVDYEVATYNVNKIPFDECKKYIRQNGQQLLEENTICVLADSRSDPNCDLDIGGPLFDEKTMLFGVATRRSCGSFIDAYEKINNIRSLMFIIETMKISNESEKKIF